MRDTVPNLQNPTVILRVPDSGKVEGQTKNDIIPRHATKHKQVQIFTKVIKLYTHSSSKAQSEPTAVTVRLKALRFLPPKHWDRGFEPHFMHGCMPASLLCVLCKCVYMSCIGPISHPRTITYL
jgi:hypothetical protein